jgi:nucleotide-binding universal stress UspA family protein
MFNAILLPVDGSALSFKPVQAVIELAKLSGSKIVVLSVAKPRLFWATDSDSLQSGKELEIMNLEAARKNVQKVQAVAEQAGVACEGVASMANLPCDEILDTVQKANCDLIAMATRGKMGVIDTIFGESTTQEVIRKSPVPVLVFT